MPFASKNSPPGRFVWTLFRLSFPVSVFVCITFASSSKSTTVRKQMYDDTVSNTLLAITQEKIRSNSFLLPLTVHLYKFKADHSKVAQNTRARTHELYLARHTLFIIQMTIIYLRILCFWRKTDRFAQLESHDCCSAVGLHTQTHTHMH